MFFFESRKMAREFAQKREHYKVKDHGTNAPAGRRWAVKVL